MNKIKKIKKKYQSCLILIDLAWSCLILLNLTRSLAWSCLPLILQVLARWSCLILVKNHLARSCKILQDRLLDLAYLSNLQALARSCHLLSLSKSSCKNRLMGLKVINKCRFRTEKSDLWKFGVTKKTNFYTFITDTKSLRNLDRLNISLLNLFSLLTHLLKTIIARKICWYYFVFCFCTSHCRPFGCVLFLFAVIVFKF